MEATEWRISATDNPGGAHWDSMRPVDEHLAHEIGFMRDVVAVSRDERSPELFERLDLGTPPVEDPWEEATDLVNGWALELRVARWEGGGFPGDCERELARVVAVLGTGGPHVEIDVTCDAQGDAESVELRRYWSGSDSARTDDPDALDVVNDFLAALIA